MACGPVAKVFLKRRKAPRLSSEGASELATPPARWLAEKWAEECDRRARIRDTCRLLRLDEDDDGLGSGGAVLGPSGRS